MRSLFLRIFLSLAVAFILVSLAVFLVAAGSGTIPLSTPVLARAVLFGEIHAMAENVLSLYETAGPEPLGHYLDKLHQSSGTRVWLLDSNGVMCWGTRFLPQCNASVVAPSSWAYPLSKSDAWSLPGPCG